jgi:ABC-type glycerol-3-phosphate transport system substrate-binding protein
VTDGEGNPMVDRRSMVQALTFYSQCITSGVISPSQVLSLTNVAQAWDEFVAAGAGITLVDAGTYSSRANETTAAASAPTRDGDPFSIARGWVITVVTKEPTRQAVAMLLFDWLIDSEQNAAWTRAEGYLPGTRSAVMFLDAPESERVMLSQLLEGTVPTPPLDTMQIVGPAMQRGLEALLQGKASAMQAAAIAVAAVSE